MPRARMIKPRAGTAAEWATADAAGRLLALNEIGYITDTDVFVMGDGVTATLSLPAAGTGSSGFADPLPTAGGEAITDRSVTHLNMSVLGASGQVAFYMFTARRTETINSIRTFSGTTAAGATPTLCKVGVYSIAANGDATRLVVSANNTALWSVANTTYTQALLAPFSKIAGQRYAVAMGIVTAAALPTHIGISQPASTGYLADYYAVLPKISANASGQTDLQPSYTNAQISVSGSRQFAAMLVP